eukprot:c28400_g1_i1 orf=217-1821(+)
MESVVLSACCTIANSRLWLQGRGRASRVLGFSGKRCGVFVCCDVSLGNGVAQLGMPSWAPRNGRVVGKISADSCLRTFIDGRHSRSGYEKWMSWISDETDGGDNSMQMDACVQLNTRWESVDDTFGIHLTENDTSGGIMRTGGSFTTIGNVLERLEMGEFEVALSRLFCYGPNATKAKEVLLLLSTALLLWGVGLGFNMAARASSVTPQATVTFVQSTQDSRIEKGNATSTKDSQTQPEEETSTRVGGGINEDSLSSEDSTSVPETVGKSGGFTEEFWMGIEAPEESMVELLKSYLEKHPDSVMAIEALLYTRMETGDIPHALKILERLIALEPHELEWKFMKAQCHEYVGDLRLAKAGFEEILRVEPLSSRALQGMVTVMDRTGETDSALEMIWAALTRAIQEKRIAEARDLRLLIGQVYTLQGKLEEALQQYTVMIDEDPKDFRPYLCQGLVYSILGKTGEADKRFKKYRQLCPKDFPNRKFLDELMLKAKNEGHKTSNLKKLFERTSKDGKDPKSLKQPFVTGDKTKGLAK